MSRFQKTVLWTGLLLLLGCATAAVAIDVPYLQGRVTDNAEVLSTDARRDISVKLEAHERSTTDQIAVLTINSLEGESIEAFAVRVFEQWQLGKRGEDNGVLIIVAPRDRRMRIEVGYGLEGVINDAKAGRIGRTYLEPALEGGQGGCLGVDGESPISGC